MLRFLRADLRRMAKGRPFALLLLAMALLSAAMLAMQATAMDYTVPLSRVVFLPLSFYGVAAAAFVSAFVGTDFSDGCIRNKLVAARKRRDVALALVLSSAVGCAAAYALSALLTLGIGRFLFEGDVSPAALSGYFALGLGMSLSVACLFAVVSLLCGSKTRGIVWCMGIAFAMLVLALRTHQVLAQPEWKDGLPNPHYATGLRRALCGVLHDLNPCGQAAQLSSWHTWNPLRMALCDLAWVLGVPAAGCAWFEGKDIQ